MDVVRNMQRLEYGTFVNVVLSEALNRTFDRNLLNSSSLGELKFANRRVFGEDVPELQVV